MKTLCAISLLTFFSTTLLAQNTNIKSEETTVITTIKDASGEKKIVKSEVKKELQPIELENEKPNSINIDTKESPVTVLTKTKVSVNGETQFIDVDHSAYYEKDGQKYQILLDASGYIMKTASGNQQTHLKRTSNNNYIFKNKGVFAVGYFDAEGNLIVETYDEKTDTITLEKYSVVKS
ncbi:MULTISPECIES: hypothetical protein [Flavobacterium]|uniref:Nicotinic acid mononucleotide adenyltransferase n=1 Tax=Flavobacterium sedimenticola TaxID=3043286 RepID=A0ABT6XTQ0_9FLAO|nr:hypothetical protein [Flavobacterium sedimenticola]MDI9258476.1 hypothetical protein [Flavobacterium sedimenticola]